MKTANLVQNLQYNEKKPNVELLLETSFSKELRISLKNGQVMKEHKAPYPIVVELFEGELEFGVEGKPLHLKRGDMINLDANVVHDLIALDDSVVRLTISKMDEVDRVNEVANK